MSTNSPDRVRPRASRTGSPVFQSTRLDFVFEPAAGHQLRETVIVDLGNRKGCDFAPVPEDRYAFSKLDDFLQPMTYENDGHTKLLQTPDYREQQSRLHGGSMTRSARP